MEFRFEHQMTKPVVGWLRSQQLLIKAELPTPWGVCDLVGCSINKHRLRKRLALRQRQGIGSLLRMNLLSAIPDQDTGHSIELEALRTLLGEALSLDLIEKEVKTLIDRNFVLRDGCSLQKLNGWFPLHRRILAVELKIDRIEEALHQAKANRGFTDESYVALPLSIAKQLSVSKRDSFEAAGVGLLGVSKTRVQMIFAAAAGTAADSNIQAHCVERFWPEALQAV